MLGDAFIKNIIYVIDRKGSRGPSKHIKVIKNTSLYLNYFHLFMLISKDG